MTADVKIDKTQIRNAATVIVLRDRTTSPSILMGQRGSKAAFMPNKFVFPGGAVDAGDSDFALGTPLPDLSHQRLKQDSSADMSNTLTVAAIRDLLHESGQILGHKEL